MNKDTSYIKCPLCGEKVRHKMLKCNGTLTHMWCCEQCPMVMIEYYSPADTLNLEDFLNGDDCVGVECMPTKVTNVTVKLLQEKLAHDFFEDSKEALRKLNLN